MPVGDGLPLRTRRRDPLAGPPQKKAIDVTPKTVRPSVALPEVSFDFEDLELPPPEGRYGAPAGYDASVVARGHRRPPYPAVFPMATTEAAGPRSAPGAQEE